MNEPEYRVMTLGLSRGLFDDWVRFVCAIDHRLTASAWISGVDGRFLTVSRGYAGRLRHAKKELIGAQAYADLPSDLARRLRAEDGRLVRAPRAELCLEAPNQLHPSAWSVRVRYPLVDGEGRVVAISGALLPLESLRPVEMILAQRFSTGPTAGRDWLAEVRDRLDSRSRPAPLRQIAGDLSKHPDYVGREFQRWYGVTVSAYVRARRVALAAHILATSVRPLVDVALDSGFCDQSHMTREFKRILAVTPSVFRHRQPLESPPWRRSRVEAPALDRVFCLPSPTEPLRSSEASGSRDLAGLV